MIDAAILLLLFYLVCNSIYTEIISRRKNDGGRVDPYQELLAFNKLVSPAYKVKGKILHRGIDVIFMVTVKDIDPQNTAFETVEFLVKGKMGNSPINYVTVSTNLPYIAMNLVDLTADPVQFSYALRHLHAGFDTLQIKSVRKH